MFVFTASKLLQSGVAIFSPTAAFINVSRAGSNCAHFSATGAFSSHLWPQNFGGNALGPVTLMKSSRFARLSLKGCFQENIHFPVCSLTSCLESIVNSMMSTSATVNEAHNLTVLQVTVDLIVH